MGDGLNRLYIEDEEGPPQGTVVLTERLGQVDVQSVVDDDLSRDQPWSRLSAGRVTHELGFALFGGVFADKEIAGMRIAVDEPDGQPLRAGGC